MTVTEIRLNEGCDLREILENTNFDGGGRAGGEDYQAHVWGLETKEVETTPLLGCDFSSIPSGDTITEVLLYLYVYGYSDTASLGLDTFSWTFWACLRNWDTTLSTFVVYTAPWTTKGGRGSGTDRDSPITATNGPTTGSIPYWWVVDVTDIANECRDSHNDRFQVLCHGPESVLEEAQLTFDFYGYKAAGDYEQYKPYLKFTHSAPAGGSRNWGTVIGSRLGLRLPSLPRGWLRRPDLRGLVLPAGA